MKNYYKLLTLLCATLLAASCGTKKQAMDSAVGTEPSLAPLQNIVQTVNANRHNETYATAKVNLALSTAIVQIIGIAKKSNVA